MKVLPVILAAGESKRMGAPKPYMKLEGRTFLEIIASRLENSGASFPGIIVFNEQHHSLIQSLSLPQFDLISNERQELGQLYSLQLAIRMIPHGITGVLLCLADHPLIHEESYRRIVEMHILVPHKVILPTYEDRPGHPTLFPRLFFQEIQDLAPEKPEGVKNVLFDHPDAVMDIPLQDPGILMNLDSPEDISQMGFEFKT